MGLSETKYSCLTVQPNKQLGTMLSTAFLIKSTASPVNFSKPTYTVPYSCMKNNLGHGVHSDIPLRCECTRKWSSLGFESVYAVHHGRMRIIRSSRLNNGCFIRT